MFKPAKNVPLGTDTLIGQGTEVEGKIVCSTNLRIEGMVKGDIECSYDITIGETSVCHSNITAKDIIIAGKVHGDLNVKGKLTIMPTGQLHGNFTSDSLIIHEGGVFNGSSNMKRIEAVPQKQEAEHKEKARKSS